MQEPHSNNAVNPPQPLCTDPARHWILDPEITFLNHGSFGAVPRVVLDSQSRWRERIERRPIEMLDRRMAELMAPAHEAVGMLVQAPPTTVGFISNATSALNAILRSMQFAPGECLVTTSHVYNAVRKTMEWVARRDGAQYVELPLELPVESRAHLADRILDSLPDNTRLFLIDHISSPTAVHFPLELILPELAKRGIQTVVDGAHAPGMVDVDLQKLCALGAVAWTGNLHKWCFAPKGTAVLHVCDELRDQIQPSTISHFADEGFHERFAWQGTADMTAWLSVPDALAFVEAEFGWPQLRKHNHEMAVWAHQMLCDRFETDPLTPLDGSLLGSIASVELPSVLMDRFADSTALQAALYNEYNIEVPIMDWSNRWLVRVSCQAYNRPEEYVALSDAVQALVARS